MNESKFGGCRPLYPPFWVQNIEKIAVFRGVQIQGLEVRPPICGRFTGNVFWCVQWTQDISPKTLICILCKTDESHAITSRLRRTGIIWSWSLFCCNSAKEIIFSFCRISFSRINWLNTNFKTIIQKIFFWEIKSHSFKIQQKYATCNTILATGSICASTLNYSDRNK